MTHKRWPPNGFLSQWILDQFPEGYRGYAIDVGASDGISINTTWALEKHHGWTVVSVEANPEFYPMLLRERAMVEKCACGPVAHPGTSFYINKSHPESFSALVKPSHPVVRSWEDPNPWDTITVPVKTVDEIIARWEFPRLDALCVDVEGTEVDVLNGCDLAKWKPKAVIVECWDRGGHDAYLARFGYKRKANSVDNDLYLLVED